MVEGGAACAILAITAAGSVKARRMFGEYGIYCDGKIVALVCDDQLYLRPTPAGRVLLGKHVDEQPPYPGAKPSFRIDGELWDDAEWLAGLVRMTAAALPMTKKNVKAAKQKR